MIQTQSLGVNQSSSYINFSRDLWKTFRKETPMTLSENDILHIRGIADPISLLEIEEVYLPLSRLLNLYVAATQSLYQVSTKFLNHPEPKVPYVIGVSGSVGVGKSTTSRVLQALLSRWTDHPRVDIVNTDGFIYPNAILNQCGLMAKKGFPESYNLKQLIKFLTNLKSGCPILEIPIYSHYYYDIKPGEFQTILQPDIIILEGLNILQGNLSKAPKPCTFISDFLDFTIYVDAKTSIIRQWFLERFKLFRKNATNDKAAFFHRFVHLKEEDALKFATKVWVEINEANLIKNILPFKHRAKLILSKGVDHYVHQVSLKKI